MLHGEGDPAGSAMERPSRGPRHVERGVGGEGRRAGEGRQRKEVTCKRLEPRGGVT